MANSNSLDVNEIFSPGGLIAKSFGAFESRPQQLKMGLAVQNALANKKHLAIEAGTGVGKSFAYLIPAIQAIHAGADKILVSTHTITLQEQLINKDLPFLAQALPHAFCAVLAKGRGNYLCQRRLEYAFLKKALTFDKSSGQLAAIHSWASQTKDGSLSDLDFIPDWKVWDSVNSEHGNCRGNKCPHLANCFYKRARKQLDSADIIVANHALMFSDLVLKEEKFSLLPDYEFVIIDEAHNIEHVAEDYFGINISSWTIKLLLDGLYNPVSKKGILAFTKADDTIDLVIDIERVSKEFFKKVQNWYDESAKENGGRCEKNFVDDTISGHLKKLRSKLSALAADTDDVDDKFEIMRFVNKCADLLKDIENFLNQSKPEYVYWVESSKKSSQSISLRSAPINVGPDVKRTLFDKYQSVILTSATLSCSSKEEKEGFEFLAGRVGLENFEAVKLGSPFDYENQVTIYLEKNLPNPNSPDFIHLAVENIKKYLIKSCGRAFVLFTSYQMLETISQQMSDWMRQNDFELLVQGSGIDRSTLLKLFKEDKHSVLFGTDSFWQGVDVPGDALGNVIIVRLPFAVPSQPLLAGRLEQIKQQGGNPFFDYQLPSAIIKFKQGFGRLIRTKTDSGIIVVLDSRIINQPYGKQFLNAVPKCKVQVVE